MPATNMGPPRWISQRERSARPCRTSSRCASSWWQAIENDAIQLGLQLAEKILAGTRQLPSERILETVQGGLRRVTDRRKITVLVNPAELEAVSSAIAELTTGRSGVELCDIQPDERVESGGAIVRTAEGEVDASVDTQLERAREVVEASLATELAA